MTFSSLAQLNRCVVDCRKCPRLVAWREQVADERRAAFAHEQYWGRPLPGFGDPSARVLLLGLAPAAQLRLDQLFHAQIHTTEHELREKLWPILA